MNAPGRGGGGDLRLAEALVVPGAGPVYAPLLAALGVAAGACLAVLPGLSSALAATPAEAGFLGAAWVGAATGGAAAAVRTRARAPRRRGPPPAVTGAATGAAAGALGLAAAGIAWGWSHAAWPTHFGATLAGSAAVGGALLGIGAGAALGARASLAAAGIGALAAAALAALGPVPGAAAGMDAGVALAFGTWPGAVALAAGASLAAVLAPSSGPWIGVRSGRRAGWVAPVPEGGLRLGSSKRLSDLYLPASEGVAPRHAEVRRVRGILVLTSLCGGEHGVNVDSGGRVQAAPGGTRVPLAPGDRIELRGPEGSVWLDVGGAGP
ncbi:FHA domain-containing protein [Myxococcota bacterium]|nr:FHA domain-containing protein [Myxococcota bacterium]